MSDIHTGEVPPTPQTDDRIYPGGVPEKTYDPKIGAHVLYRPFPHEVSGDEDALRPAFIVRVWGATSANLKVFMDGTNDSPLYANSELWATSRLHGKEPGQWFYPEELEG